MYVSHVSVEQVDKKSLDLDMILTAHIQMVWRCMQPYFKGVVRLEKKIYVKTKGVELILYVNFRGTRVCLCESNTNNIGKEIL